MPVRKQIIVNKFDGGISDDVRIQSANAFSVSQHFDNFTAPNKLSPFRDYVTNDTGHVGIMNFAWDGANLYGLGILTSGPKAQIYKKTSLTGNWTTPSTAVSGTVNTVLGTLCLIYKTRLYHWCTAGELNYWTLGSTYTEAAIAAGPTRASAQGIIHSQTDTAYFPYDNKIASDDNGVLTTAALTLPSNYVITAIAEYGSYLAIACRPVGLSTSYLPGAGTSKVFLWDMVSADVTTVVDFGAGDLMVLGTVDGILVGIMNGQTSTGITFDPQKVYIKTYSGGPVALIKTLADTTLSIATRSNGAGVNFDTANFIQSPNGLSFGMISSGSVVPTGIYTFSRAAGGSVYSITCERNISNATSITSLAATFRVGDVWFNAFNVVANTSSNVSRTNDSVSYTDTSFVETQKYSGGDISELKQLTCVTVMTQPMPSGGTYTLKYKVDSDSSYTTIATNSTQNSLGKEHINIESTGKNFPVFHEIQFRVESTGGTVITGLKFLWEPQKTLAQLK